MLDQLKKIESERYDPSGLNLGESISELKRIAEEISTVGIIQGNSEDVVKHMWIKTIIEHMEIPELVGHEEKDNHIEA